MLCAVSGGKDSYTLHDMLVKLARRSPVKFTMVAVNIDQGHPGYPGHVLEAYMRDNGHEFRMVKEDTYSIPRPPTRSQPEDVLLALLPAAARHPLRAGPRDGLQQDCARAPSRRRAGHAHAEPDLLGPAEVDAAEAPRRRRQERRHPSARLLRREGHRRVRGLSHIFLSCRAISAARRTTSSARSRLLADLEVRRPGLGPACSPRSAT